jgi:hypothetical protein
LSLATPSRPKLVVNVDAGTDSAPFFSVRLTGYPRTISRDGAIVEA